MAVSQTRQRVWPTCHPRNTPRIGALACVEMKIEQPTELELVINLRAAKQVSVMVPPNVLARADKVIKP